MKEILERAGFIYQGRCRVCEGEADLFTKGNVQAKIRVRQMKFELQIGNNKIKGKSADLEMALQKWAT